MNKRIVIASLMLLATGATIYAQDAKPPVPSLAVNVPPSTDPKADELLKRAGETLAKAKTFSFTAHDFSDRIITNGQKVQLSKTVNVLVRRPDAIFADVKGDVEDRQIFYSGTKLVIFNRADNVYAMADVPNDIDKMFDFVAEKYGITAPLSDLMFADPYKTLTERVRSGLYLGLHDVMGTKCHHLAFRQDGLDWQIWLEDTAQALPRKVVITFKEQPGYPQYIALLDGWDLNAKADDAKFIFTPPAGATRKDMEPIDAPAPAENK